MINCFQFCSNVAFSLSVCTYTKALCRLGGGVFVVAPVEMTGGSSVTVQIATELTPGAEKRNATSGAEGFLRATTQLMSYESTNRVSASVGAFTR